MTHWFFDDYLTTWIGVGAGTIERGPEFILDYWSAPLHWSDRPESIGGFWMRRPWWRCCRTAPNSFARTRDTPTLRSLTGGFGPTTIDGAAIEVIWSRQRADGTEIEKLAAHFEVARGPQGWRIVSIQAVPATSDSLKVVWPQSF